MRLVPDRSSGIGSYIGLTGYNTIAFNIFSKKHIYSNNLGSPIADSKPISTYQA
jgi:hypothetical protein